MCSAYRRFDYDHAFGWPSVANLNLAGANLEGANLSNSYLSRCSLSGAHLNTANLKHASIDDCDLSDAILANANLSGAQLPNSNLARAMLFGTTLSGTWFFASHSGEDPSTGLTQERLREARADSANPPRLEGKVVDAGTNEPIAWRGTAFTRRSPDRDL